jgi:hypothetical protein
VAEIVVEIFVNSSLGLLAKVALKAGAIAENLRHRLPSKTNGL